MNLFWFHINYLIEFLLKMLQLKLATFSCDFDLIWEFFYHQYTSAVERVSKKSKNAKQKDTDGDSSFEMSFVSSCLSFFEVVFENV